MTIRNWAFALTLCSCMAVVPAAAEPQTQSESVAQQSETERIIQALDPGTISPMNAAASAKRLAEIIEIEPSLLVSVDYAHRVVLPLPFGQNSNFVNKAVEQQLLALGKALQDDTLADYSYLIAGHTDADGEARFNDLLSFQRAHAVKAFLVQAFAIKADRLIPVGWGERRLPNAEAPYSKDNQVIEVTLITDRLALSDRLSHRDASVIRSMRPRGTQPITSRDALYRKWSSACDDRFASDPRPRHHRLDDFGTGRTPLKCADPILVPRPFALHPRLGGPSPIQIR